MALLIMQEHTDARLCKPVKKRKTLRKAFISGRQRWSSFLENLFLITILDNNPYVTGFFICLL